MDNSQTGYGEKTQREKFCGHVGNAMDKRGIEEDEWTRKRVDVKSGVLLRG